MKKHLLAPIALFLGTLSLSAQIPTNGLVSKWSFESRITSQFTKDEQGSFPLTNNGAITGLPRTTGDTANAVFGSATSGAGNTGTCFSGGAAGGGSGSITGTSGGNAGSANGGAGGAGVNVGGAGITAGGGAGNPGGAGAIGGSAGSNGTGGLLILIIRGNLTIGASGVISSNGASGGDGSCGGGGSGGGTLVILYAGTLSNSGTIQANGGPGGTGTGNGGAGGAGSVQGPTVISP
jgi:hypothetical protein